RDPSPFIAVSLCVKSVEAYRDVLRRDSACGPSGCRAGNVSAARLRRMNDARRPTAQYRDHCASHRSRTIMKTIASIGGRRPVLGALLALGVAACAGPGVDSSVIE